MILLEHWVSSPVRRCLYLAVAHTILLPLLPYPLLIYLPSFIVRPKAQLHAKAIVKTLPAFPFQTLSFSKPESSISADLKTDFSELKTCKALVICDISTRYKQILCFEKCISSQFQLIHTLSKAESVPFSVSSWDSGLKAAWTCTTAWKPGRSGVSNWPTFLSQFLSLTENQPVLRQHLKILWLHPVLSENHRAEWRIINKQDALMRDVLAGSLHRLGSLCEGQHLRQMGLGPY